MRKFADEKIDWPKIFDAMAHPKMENGEEYIDVSEREMAAINKYADFLLAWKYIENPRLSESERRKADERYQALTARQFAYLNKKQLTA